MQNGTAGRTPAKRNDAGAATAVQQCQQWRLRRDSDLDRHTRLKYLHFIMKINETIQNKDLSEISPQIVNN